MPAQPFPGSSLVRSIGPGYPSPTVVQLASGDILRAPGILRAMPETLAQSGPISFVDVEDLPPEVIDQLEELEPDVVDDLRNGVIDQIPEEVVDRLPVGVQDQIPDALIDAASANPAFAAVLVIIGVLAVVMLVWAIFKSAIKIAVFSGILGAAAWFWFFRV